MLSIKVNVANYTYTPAQRILANNEEFQEGFAKYLVKQLKKELQYAIDTQKYSYKWKPLSISYLKYKATHNLSLKIWEATGLLRDSIVYRKRNGYYLVGIDPYAKYKDGTSVLFIAKCMEYGTSRMPARPLFRYVLNNTRKSIRRYYNNYLKEVGEVS